MKVLIDYKEKTIEFQDDFIPVHEMVEFLNEHKEWVEDEEWDILPFTKVEYQLAPYYPQSGCVNPPAITFTNGHTLYSYTLNNN